MVTNRDIQAENVALCEALKGVVRIVEAFSLHTQLGRTQKERLDAARAVLARMESAR